MGEQFNIWALILEIKIILLCCVVWVGGNRRQTFSYSLSLLSLILLKIVQRQSQPEAILFFNTFAYTLCHNNYPVKEEHYCWFPDLFGYVRRPVLLFSFLSSVLLCILVLNPNLYWQDCGLLILANLVKQFVITGQEED